MIALYGNTTGSANTAVGFQAGFSGGGDGNTAVGLQGFLALSSNWLVGNTASACAAPLNN